MSSNRGKLAYLHEILRDYPEIKRKPADKRTAQELRRAAVVSEMLDDLRRMTDGQHRQRLVKLVYFDRSHTVYGAAMVIGISRRQAERWNAKMVENLAGKIGLI